MLPTPAHRLARAGGARLRSYPQSSCKRTLFVIFPRLGADVGSIVVVRVASTASCVVRPIQSPNGHVPGALRASFICRQHLRCSGSVRDTWLIDMQLFAVAAEYGRLRGQRLRRRAVRSS